MAISSNPYQYRMSEDIAVAPPATSRDILLKELDQFVKDLEKKHGNLLIAVITAQKVQMYLCNNSCSMNRENFLNKIPEILELAEKSRKTQNRWWVMAFQAAGPAVTLAGAGWVAGNSFNTITNAALSAKEVSNQLTNWSSQGQVGSALGQLIGTGGGFGNNHYQGERDWISQVIAIESIRRDDANRTCSQEEAKLQEATRAIQQAVYSESSTFTQMTGLSSS